MVISLLAVTLTYHVLSAHDFALFNMAVFLMAIGSALSQPLNRIFWAGNSEAVLPLSSGASALLTTCVVIAGMVAASMVRGYPTAVLLLGAFSAGLYGLARVLERYAYGRLLVAGFASVSVLPILSFAMVDLAAVGGMWAWGSDNVVLRMLLPSIGFLALAMVVSRFSNLPAWITRVPRVSEQVSFIRENLFSVTGGRIIISGIVMAAAAMIDRAILYIFPLDSENFAAAYLLALAYTVAFQTFLYLLFDLARTHIYRDGNWQPGALHFGQIIVAVAVLATAIAAVAYPVVVALELLPSEVSWLLWTALLARSLALAVTMVLNVDHFQEGRVRNIVVAAGIVAVGAVTGLGTLYAGKSLVEAATLMLVFSVGVIIVVAAMFLKRVPAV